MIKTIKNVMKSLDFGRHGYDPDTAAMQKHRSGQGREFLFKRFIVPSSSSSQGSESNVEHLDLHFDFCSQPSSSLGRVLQ